MVFSSTIFIFLFLPVTLILYFLAFRFRGKGSVRASNAVLLGASLVFYGWGGLTYLGILLAVIGANWALTLLMEQPGCARFRKGIFWLIMAIDLGNLLYFKYSGFFAETAAAAVSAFGGQLPIEIPQVALPIGISFYTFQIISYVADVYRGDAEVQRNPFRLALYVTMFPQLIAGPIVRYTDVEREIRQREIHMDDVETGVQRFIIGFAKKVFLANLTGGMADVMFGYGGELNTAYCWLGILCYALQIYYDFSAYSDMAIGIGRMLGFRFNENFDHPYVSLDIREFWRRWHISLSTWFRDYVYIPLGGSREGKWRTYRNLGIVFLLTGFWHGAAWQFIVWGLYHGAFCILERLGLKKALDRLPKFLRRLYTMLVVLIGWVFFRADSLPEAVTYIRNLFSFDFADFRYRLVMAQLTPLFWTCFALACLFAFVDVPGLLRRIEARIGEGKGKTPETEEGAGTPAEKIADREMPEEGSFSAAAADRIPGEVSLSAAAEGRIPGEVSLSAAAEGRMHGEVSLSAAAAGRIPGEVSLSAAAADRKTPEMDMNAAEGLNTGTISGEKAAAWKKNLLRLGLLVLWIASVLYLTGLSYNPFIYFKF